MAAFAAPMVGDASWASDGGHLPSVVVLARNDSIVEGAVVRCAMSAVGCLPNMS